MCRFPLPVVFGVLVLSWLFPAHAEQVLSPECERAWTAYNELKARTVMEESQYTLTVQGAAVRAACGKDALPAPPNADVPPKPRVRKPQPTPPAPAPESTGPSSPQAPSTA